MGFRLFFADEIANYFAIKQIILKPLAVKYLKNSNKF